MLTYHMDGRGKLSRYDYLYRCIKDDILSGQLKPGEKLPSKRTLAAHLNLAVVTVANAYAQLVAEGYLYTREKRGYFVSSVEADRVVRAQPEPEQESVGDSWLLDLWGSGSGTEGFPFSVWARLTRRVLTDGGERLLRATPHNGVLELRQAIAQHLHQFRGITVRPEQIVVGAGTEYLYNLLVQLLGRELVYGLEDPGYSKGKKIYTLNGARCILFPVDDDGIPPEILEGSECQVLHISPNHQFPTGVVTPISRRQRMLRWAGEEKGRYIIEDDYDSEFRFTGRPIPPLQNIDKEGCVIYINTFSRSLVPSLRISYMVLPPSLLGQYQQKLGFYSCTVPAIEQYTLAHFLDEGYFESHINRMKVFYRNRRDQVIGAIQASSLAGRCQVLRSDAGLHFLLKLDTEQPDRILAEKAKAQNIRLSFLSDHQRLANKAQEHTLVINYSGLNPGRMERGLEQIARLLD